MMTSGASLPYTVTDVKHERAVRSDHTIGGQYHVTIQHATGETSKFTVPEGPNAASDAHAAAMEQVAEVAAIKQLPVSPESGS